MPALRILRLTLTRRVFRTPAYGSPRRIAAIDPDAIDAISTSSQRGRQQHRAAHRGDLTRRDRRLAYRSERKPCGRRARCTAIDRAERGFGRAQRKHDRRCARAKNAITDSLSKARRTSSCNIDAAICRTRGQRRKYVTFAHAAFTIACVSHAPFAQDLSHTQHVHRKSDIDLRLMKSAVFRGFRTPDRSVMKHANIPFFTQIRFLSSDHTI